jgi:phage terminase large subunit-like protein
VTASQGKRTRAEPVAGVYEQGRVHHVAVFSELEEQMVSWLPGEPSPDRMDSLVWAMSDLLGLAQGPAVEPEAAVPYTDRVAAGGAVAWS